MARIGYDARAVLQDSTPLFPFATAAYEWQPAQDELPEKNLMHPVDRRDEKKGNSLYTSASPLFFGQVPETWCAKRRAFPA
jgi:hypothetical protein